MTPPPSSDNDQEREALIRLIAPVSRCAGDEWAADRILAAGFRRSAWIACDTVLPEDGTDVEIRYRNGTTEIAQYRQHRQCMLGSRAGAYGPGWSAKEADYLPVDDVTHWRPLPAPPAAQPGEGSA